MLHEAAISDDVHAALRLVCWGVPVNATDNDGATALHHAAHNGTAHTYCCFLLL